MATPDAPLIVAGGGSILMIEGAKAQSTAKEIKQLTLAPTKPSDLETAAQKLAQLAMQGKVIAGAAVLGGIAASLHLQPRLPRCSSSRVALKQ